MLGWSAGMDQVWMLGDLNETLTRWDREPQSARLSGPASPISCLVQQGFTDVYRRLHPSPLRNPGFTHTVPGLRPSQSRIDYIWCKGLSFASLLSVHVDPGMRTLSHHRLLWTEIQLDEPIPSACSTPLLRLRLPNLRIATQEQLDACVQHVEKRVSAQQDEFRALTQRGDPVSLDGLASRLTGLVRRAAFATLPITGSAAFRSADMLQLQRQRRSLTQLLRLSRELQRRSRLDKASSSTCLIRSLQWRQQYHDCREEFDLQWSVDPFCGAAVYAWEAETRDMLRDTRAAIRAEQKRMVRERRTPVEANPAALVHRMLKSDALPSQLQSVVDSSGSLTSTAEELEAVMVGHFRSVFALPRDDLDAAGVGEPPAMLLDKDSVDPSWYASLLDDFKEEEVFFIFLIGCRQCIIHRAM